MNSKCEDCECTSIVGMWVDDNVFMMYWVTRIAYNND